MVLAEQIYARLSGGPDPYPQHGHGGDRNEEQPDAVEPGVHVPNTSNVDMVPRNDEVAYG
jgi:hypothetical protein